MARKLIVLLCGLAMIAATFSIEHTQAQSSSTRLLTELLLPRSNDTKYPDVAAAGSRVFVAGNIGREDSVLWTKNANATSFANPAVVGPAEGQPDYSPAAVAAASDGSVYVVWINQPERIIYIRRRDSAGNWGAERIVDRGSPFPASIQVAVTTDNQIFVIWRDPDAPAKFRVSGDRGATWSGRRNVVNRDVYGVPMDIAAGPGGRLGVVYTAGVNDTLQIFAALWNGSSFVESQVTALSGDYAEPSISFGPTGTPYVAWRGTLTSGPASGAFYSERQSNGSWARSRLTGGDVTGTVNITADASGNLHVSWIARPSGGNQLYYAFKPANAQFNNPIASGERGAIFNPQADAAITGGRIYNHVASEEFSGSRLYARYSLFEAEGVIFGAQPVIGTGAATVGVRPDGTVPISFTNISGSPTQVRWRWNAPPTDTANDSGGWRTFQTNDSVTVPASVINKGECTPSTLYTQLRNANQIQEPRTASAVVDGSVGASVTINNPFSPTASTAELGPELANTAGAAGGAPDHTRVLLFNLNVLQVFDCSGLVTASVGKDANSFEATFQLSSGSFKGNIGLPNLVNVQPGPQPVLVRVTDQLGNFRDFNFTIFYDPNKPVLNGGSVTASPNPSADMLQDLNFQNIQVSDAYPAPGFWGVWVANSRTQLTDPLNANLNWAVVPARASSGTFSIEDWSLATGLAPEQRTPGDYYIYVRFLDGAGNPTDGFREIAVTSQMVQPKEYMPLSVR